MVHPRTVEFPEENVTLNTAVPGRNCKCALPIQMCVYEFCNNNKKCRMPTRPSGDLVAVAKLSLWFVRSECVMRISRIPIAKIAKRMNHMGSGAFG